MDSPDVAIPIVFPDYLITVSTPPVVINPPHQYVPQSLQGYLPNPVRIPGTSNKFPELGHAGILFIHGARGTTKYYEYGRYDKAALGLTRKIDLPDVRSMSGGLTEPKLATVMAKISRSAGQGGRISAAMAVVPGGYQKMLTYALKRVAENSNSNRKPYDILRNSCVHFMRDTLAQTGLNLPGMIDPRPNGYIDELRDLFIDVDFAPASGKVTFA